MNVWSSACSFTTSAFGAGEGGTCNSTTGGGITSFDLADNADGGGTSGDGYTNNYRSRNTPYISGSGTVPVYIDIFRTDGYPDCDAVIGGTANGTDNTENYNHGVNYSEYTLTIQKT
jgi:hypothetical protein